MCIRSVRSTLPVAVNGNSSSVDDLVGRLVADLGAGELDQLLRGRRIRSGVQCDIGADVLAVDLVVDAHDADVLDGGMLDQDGLDLLRADVRAVVDDDLLLAAAEAEVAVRRRRA